MTAAAQKTPVSLLFSMCVQRGWEQPEYELTAVEGASHDPTFTYKVKVQDVFATASGQSKRKAKHSAAKIALEQLLSKPDVAEMGFMFDNCPVTAKTLEDIIVEPVSEPPPVGADGKNFIGILQEYCTKNKKLPPYYETVHESGPPHDKTFIVQCMIGQIVTEGEAKTKRIGKRIAAEIMMKKLLEADEKNSKETDENASKETDEKTSEEAGEKVSIETDENSLSVDKSKEEANSSLCTESLPSNSEAKPSPDDDIVVANKSNDESCK